MWKSTMKKPQSIDFTAFAGLFPTICLLAALFLAEGGSALLCAVCAVLWHETGHVVFFLLTGASLPRFAPDKFGFRLFPAFSLTAGKSFLICLGGPLFNLAAGVALYRLSGGAGGLGLLGGVQLLSGLFNLLPIGTMDGGRLFLLFTERFFPRKAALLFRFAEGVTLGFLFFFSVFCFYFSGSGLYGIFFSLFFFGKAAKDGF